MTATSRPAPRLIAALSALSLAVGLSACGGDDEPATTEGGVELVAEGVLTTCTALPYEPFQFEDGGEIVGFDVAVVDAIAEDLGVTQEIIDTPFEGINSGADLTSGTCDIAAAGMTITDTREENLDFSDPYFDATQALLVPTGGATSLEELSGGRLGVQASTTGEVYAQENGEGVELVQFEDLGLLIAALESQQVDAIINDNGVLFDYENQNEGYEVSVEFDTGEQYGLGVATGNTALLEQVNETLARIREDGTYEEIYQTWFGQAPEASSS